MNSTRQKKKRILVVCPGRGSYTKETLGYLKKHKAPINEFVAFLDRKKESLGEMTLSELDQVKSFKTNIHTKGEHASTLIYACSRADYMLLRHDEYDITAITGNSMGWYIALALGGVLDHDGAFEVINTMGSMMKEGLIGGQIIYPIFDDNWVFDNKKVAMVDKAISEVNQEDGCEAYISIYLGGYRVIGGNKKALSELMKKLPQIEHYPFQLMNHAAFHTPLLESVSVRAFTDIDLELFSQPKVPLIDGRGYIWQPYSTRPEDIYHYTLGDQVFEAYDFSKAVTVGLKEFAPDEVVLLGPGGSLGSSIGQILVCNHWQGVDSKQAFKQRQEYDPFLWSMGL